MAAQLEVVRVSGNLLSMMTRPRAMCVYMEVQPKRLASGPSSFFLAHDSCIRLLLRLLCQNSGVCQNKGDYLFIARCALPPERRTTR